MIHKVTLSAICNKLSLKMGKHILVRSAKANEMELEFNIIMINQFI